MMDSFIDDKAFVQYSSTSAWAFWNRLVLQASHEQACIRHSMAALSSLHEWIEITKRPPWQNYTFTRHYTRAITDINRRQNAAPLDTVFILISCLMFAHCDFLLGATAAGFSHLKAGYRIIDERRNSQVKVSSAIPDLLEPIIKGFLMKSQKYQMLEVQSPRATAQDPRTYTIPELSEKFVDLNDANRHLQKAVYFTIMVVKKNPPHSTQEIQEGRQYVAAWATSFARLKATIDVDSDEHVLKDWQLLLLAHHRMALLMLKALPPENDNTYSRAAADFRIMFAQMRTFLRGGYTVLETVEKSEQILNAHLGFIAPLYFIATLCRVTDIRRKAIEALRDLKVVEAHWNSCVAYAVAKAVVDIEELFINQSGRRLCLKVDSVDRMRDGQLEMIYHEMTEDGGHGGSLTTIITEPCCHHDATMMWVSTQKAHRLSGFACVNTILNSRCLALCVCMVIKR
jgi:hypothetical protein